MRLNKKKGILFLVTGLSGSGKTTIAKAIRKNIENKYGKTLLFSGDSIRNIFNLKTYSKSERLKISKKFSKLAKAITNQNINLILATVSMIRSFRKWNRKNMDNYVEIYIRSDVKKIIKRRRKKIYLKKNKQNIVGIDIKPELPEKPDIIINNDFKKSIKFLSKETLFKINKHIKS